MWHFGGIILGLLLYFFYQYLKEESDKSNEADEETEDVGQQQEQLYEASQTNKIEQEKMEQQAMPKTKELALSILSKFGCQPGETENERIQFDYQGITFLMEAIDECLFVNLIWPWCYSFSKFDIDEFSRVRQVINDINMRGSVSVFYGISDSDEVAVHIKKHFLLVPQIPDLEEYMKVVFDSFFRTARTLNLEIEKVRMKEYEK
jgi:hypothetical protein